MNETRARLRIARHGQFSEGGCLLVVGEGVGGVGGGTGSI